MQTPPRQENNEQLEPNHLTPEEIQEVIDAIIQSSELSFDTARSGGKGGQNVNKVETKVHLSFHIPSSQNLTDEMKTQLITIKKNLISKDGFLKLQAQEHRNQLANKELVIKKFGAHLMGALTSQKERKPTAPTEQSQNKRLDGKSKEKRKKEMRRDDWRKYDY